MPRAAARLTRNERFRFVEPVTNGSLIKQKWRAFAEECDQTRLSLWVTYHHSEIEPNRLLEKAEHARGEGASVVVNCLLFPDNLEKTDRLISDARSRGLCVNVDFGFAFNTAFGGETIPPVLTTVAAERIRFLLTDPLAVLAGAVALPNAGGLHVPPVTTMSSLTREATSTPATRTRSNARESLG